MGKSNKEIEIEVSIGAGNAMPFTVECGGHCCLCGHWDYHVAWNGKLLEAADTWIETCSELDENFYLEYDLPLAHGFHLQRSILADDSNQILLLGDCVICPTRSVGSVSYQSTLQSALGLNLEKEKKPSSLLFRTPKNKPVLRAIPLNGQLSFKDNVISIEQESCSSFYLPVLFDFKEQRLDKTFLFRKLTVGENLEKVPDDRAAGYRVQLGKEQFLLYRSLTGGANRTVLGHNLMDDFCYARFSAKNGVEAVVEVS